MVRERDRTSTALTSKATKRPLRDRRLLAIPADGDHSSMTAPRGLAVVAGEQLKGSKGSCAVRYFAAANGGSGRCC